MAPDTLVAPTALEAPRRTMEVSPYRAGEDDDAWEELVASSLNGTFMHRRAFLAYHGDKFQDCSVLVRDGAGKVRAVLPAAWDPAGQAVVSHPGLTYGGIVHDGFLRGEPMVEALGLVGSHYRAMGASLLRYRATPAIYHRAPAEDDIYALFRLNATRPRVDLSATIDLAGRLKTAHGRRSMLQKARRSGVEVTWGWGDLSGFWPVLVEVLGRHGASPVHSVAEILDLAARFPDNVVLGVAKADDEIVAGTVLFCSDRVVHTQYLAANDTGRRIGGLDAVIECAVDKAASSGRRYLSFGISNEEEGRVLNQPLHEFKAAFGAGAVVYERYELALG